MHIGIDNHLTLLCSNESIRAGADGTRGMG